MARRVYDAVATVGTYKNHAGEEKKRFVKIGTVFENDQGQMSLKLDSIPVGQDWSGWANFYEPKDEPAQRPQPQRQAPQAQRTSPQSITKEEFDAMDDGDDDIPF
jgi:hypothetical protein